MSAPSVVVVVLALMGQLPPQRAVAGLLVLSAGPLVALVLDRVTGVPRG